MLTNFQNKAMGIGVETLVSKAQKKIFRQDLSHKELEIIWNEMRIQGKKTLVGNIYIPPGNENHLHILDMELEKHKGENILLIGDFNSRNKMWDRNTNNNRMGLLLDDIINQHGLYIKTNTGFTYQQSTMVSNSDKSTIDLTLTRGLKNVKVVNGYGEFNLIGYGKFIH